MLPWSPSTGETDDDGERGSAALEFILVGTVLLVPLVYLIVALGMIQGQSLGAEAGARHIARALSTAPDADAAARSADLILSSVVDEYGLDGEQVDVSMACRHRPAARAARPGAGPSRRDPDRGVGGAEGLAVLGVGMRRLVERCRTVAADDEGSVLILTLGYALLAIAVILVCVDAMSLYLAQKRLDALADAAALAGADGFSFVVEGGEPKAELTDLGVREQADALVGDVGAGTTVIAAGTPDGVSARVTVAATWRPPIAALFVSEGVALQATATSRTALR